MESLTFDAPTSESRLALARALLQPKVAAEPAWPALAAAALFAVSALGLAFAAVTAQPAEFTPVPVERIITQ
jgi:hypothetical protein